MAQGDFRGIQGGFADNFDGKGGNTVGKDVQGAPDGRKAQYSLYIYRLPGAGLGHADALDNGIQVNAHLLEKTAFFAVFDSFKRFGRVSGPNR